MNVNVNKGGTRRNDTKYIFSLTQKEAFFGISKKIKVVINKKCLDCVTTCNLCGGNGNVIIKQQNGPFMIVNSITCNKCGGSGKNKIDNCIKCQGQCTINDVIFLQITFSPGVRSGDIQVFEKLGEQKQNFDDIEGNLIITAEIENNSVFTIRGNDLIYNISISFLESIIGKEINIPYYDENMILDISRYTIIQPGREYILKGKGMTIKNNDENGDMILIFNILYSNEDKEILKNYFKK